MSGFEYNSIMLVLVSCFLLGIASLFTGIAGLMDMGVKYEGKKQMRTLLRKGKSRTHKRG